MLAFVLSRWILNPNSSVLRYQTCIHDELSYHLPRFLTLVRTESEFFQHLHVLFPIVSRQIVNHVIPVIRWFSGDDPPVV